MSLPKEDMLNMRRKQAIDTIIMTMAGRIAEEYVTEDISSGAAMDIQQATQLAKAMVMHWGMSDKLGNVLYGDGPEYVFLGRDMMSRSKDYSEQTAQDIDAEVKRIIDEANNTAKELITANRDKLEIIANALLEYETLDGAQVTEIMQHGHFHPAASAAGADRTDDGCARRNAAAGNTSQTCAAEIARARLAVARAGVEFHS